jgi:hypothetical protein
MGMTFWVEKAEAVPGGGGAWAWRRRMSDRRGAPAVLGLAPLGQR